MKMKSSASPGLSVALVTAFLLLLVQVHVSVASWGGSSDKVKLKEIEVLTLRTGQYTTGRRSSPVPQLTCVGGTAGCSAFYPQVVQCYNRGSDGIDVQWECKTDMDNAFRFGKVEVTCEGYDYPDDPYVLKGSCGLEYTLDLTKEGQQHQHQQQHNYYGGGGHNQGPPPAYGWREAPIAQKGSSITNIACFVVVCIIVFAIYKTCVAPPANRQYSRTNDDYPPGQGPGARPPPPGFNPSFFGGSNTNSNDYAGDSCGSTRGGSGSANAGPAGGGFWTGAATGGLLGYLFGNRNNTGYNRGYGHTNTMFGGPQPSTSYGFRSSGSSWGGGGGSSSGFSSGSSGTRTASGFGGTRRR